MDTIDKAMIIIAVSKYAGDFPDLPGVTVSAQKLKQWAEQDTPDCGYTVLYLGDDVHEKITVELLKGQINSFLDNNFIDRLVVYFAGHGIVRSIGAQFWLLTDAASDTTEGINVEGFRRGLSKCNIGDNSDVLNHGGQLCIIGDACRNTDRDAIDFHGHPIVTRTDKRSPVQLDRFLSTGLGDYSFQIDAQGVQDAYCLFSEMLWRAVSGEEEDAIEQEHHEFKPVVTNHKLGDFLEARITKLAANLGRMEPDIATGLRPPHNYYKLLADSSVPPANDDWLAEIPLTRRMAGSMGAGSEDDRPSGRTFPDLSSMSDSVVRALSEVDSDSTFEGASSIEVDDDMPEASPFSIVSDFRPKYVAVPQLTQMKVSRATDSPMFAVHITTNSGAPALLFNGDRWTMVPNYPNVNSVLLQDIRGDVLFFKKNWQWDTFLSDYSLSSPGSESLRASEAEKFADEIRVGKERYPHHAVTAAYLYEFTNDRDNITRTAHFMVGNNCVPFDLALLSATSIEWKTENGVLRAFADLPAVTEGEEDPCRPRYTRTAFRARNDVPLWGIGPIFREGWSYMQTEQYLNVPDEIRNLSLYVGGRSAASFDSKGVEEFAKVFGYQVIDVTKMEPVPDPTIAIH